MTDTDHPRPRIENSDRGLTINKSLGWTIGCGLLLGGMWVGTNVTQLSSATEGLTAALVRTEAAASNDRTANAAVASAIEARVRALENLTTRQDARFDALSRSMDELKEAQRETNTLLRRMTGGVP